MCFKLGRSMNDVAAIVEGQTEQTFVRDHLAKYLLARRVSIWARLPGRVRRRGGVRAWKPVRGDILRTLRERPGRVCTTMFDFYGLPTDWPGRADAAKLPIARRGEHVEQALHDDLAAHAGGDFRPGLFIPYIQIHEFEALLFANVRMTAQVLDSISSSTVSLADRFQAILDESGQPEAINDGRETCPARRIAGIVPAYRKALHGPIAAGRIGIEVMRRKCPHFGQWVERLEALGGSDNVHA